MKTLVMNNFKKITLMLILIFVCLTIVVGKPFSFFLRKKAPVIQLRSVPFSKLPGWGRENLLPSMMAFQTSCNMLKPYEKIINNNFKLITKNWHSVCQASMQLHKPYTQQQLKDFFERWFEPVEFYDTQPITGLFTGYYLPLVKGSLTKTPYYNVPIYSVPNNLVTIKLNRFDPSFQKKQLIGRIIDGKTVVPYYSAEEIDQGKIALNAVVIAWIHDRVDRLFLQIQGSGHIQLPDESLLTINYAGENGAPYTAIGGVLIKQGVLTKETISMQAIRDYLTANPDQVEPVLKANKSFVFFKASRHINALGVRNIPLTPGYSMAVDQNWIPIGAPIWLNTTRPDTEHPFKRLMIAQDIGGAIRGPVRGDVFWGAGEKAASIAGKMKETGVYWVLLPKNG